MHQPRLKLKVISGANALRPVEQVPAQTITQLAIVDILLAQEKIKMLQEEIEKKSRDMEKALRDGVPVEFGAHTVLLDNGKLRIHPFRGAILRSGGL